MLAQLQIEHNYILLAILLFTLCSIHLDYHRFYDPVTGLKRHKHRTSSVLI